MTNVVILCVKGGASPPSEGICAVSLAVRLGAVVCANIFLFVWRLKGCCLSTLGTILKDNWEWRSQIVQLAIFDLKKQSRGAVLGWAWFLVRPIMYIFCFWFALDVGLRAGSVAAGAPPYILWLSAGIIPWFYMQKMLGPGIDIMHRYPYLVNKIKFPISAISTLYALSTLIVQLMLQVLVLIVYFACGLGFDVYLLQVPLLLLLMFVFWDVFSIMFSQLSAVSKDARNLMQALSTPFFWLSGVLFNVKTISADWVHIVFSFNPITFFVTGFRDAYYDKVWFWEDPLMCAGFAVVFAVTFACMLFVYGRLNKEVADVL